MKRYLTLILITICIIPVLFGSGQKQEKDKDTYKVRIGVMPDAGNLPLLLMDHVEIVPFMSAKERDVALMAGQIDGISGDLVGLLQFWKNGNNLKVLTTTTSRFMIVAAKGYSSSITTPDIGISENTVIEFMVDALWPDGSFNKLGIPQVPVRMEMLKNNKLPLACLTEGMAWPLLEEGYTIIKDQQNTDLTPAVLALSPAYLSKNEKVVSILKDEWNNAVNEINTNPDQYRHTLIEQVRLPASSNYPMPQYKTITLPNKKTFDLVKSWMIDKYGNDIDVTYNEVVIK
ncbi:ABC transporter substrate-binding protein [Spirochaeta cellobiosiphila]|uniref:ABC transporter substrate-binding protein n=1 Tax=Spirochaeta cellobiosiphila TaxID=504483 RepID=UPI00041B7974|nr:hypothetical protein [Spirochaeta cellobiosiphila]